jgi:hypothetical protein
VNWATSCSSGDLRLAHGCRRKVVWEHFSSGLGKEQRQPAWRAARGRALALSANSALGMNFHLLWMKQEPQQVSNVLHI